MSETDFDVIIAAYLIPDLARQDFDALVTLVESKQLDVEGVALVSVDPDGTVSVDETGDHLGRKGVKIGGGVGLVVGLLAPPLLASVVVGSAAGALIGKFARHKVESGLGTKLGDALPPGTAGLIAIYDRTKSDTVDKTLVSAVKKSVAEIDGKGAKQLKAALAEAQAGMGGG
jgi:arylsulfatase